MLYAHERCSKDAAPKACTAKIRYLTANAPDGATNSTNPAWAPDGSCVAIAEWPGGEGDNADIFTLDPDGGARQLVSMTAEWNFRPNRGTAPWSRRGTVRGHRLSGHGLRDGTDPPTAE